MMQSKNLKSGLSLISILVFTGIGLTITTGFVSWAFISFRLGDVVLAREQAFQIAEAGVEYYRWHLAHDPDDFQDGTGTSGPYVHDFYDKDGTKIGEFSLSITAPGVGSTLVTVESVGSVVSHPNVERSVRVRLAIPSFAKYAVVANDTMRFGEGTVTYGPIHSNGGIRFDGLAYNIVSSALSSYNDPDHSGNAEFGVHTHVSPIDPLPPNVVPDRLDVFLAGREFPVPEADFDGITADLSAMKTIAQASGLYFAPSDNSGYHLVLKTNDTMDVYSVDNLVSPPNRCSNAGQNSWGTWSISSKTLLGNYPMPNNGVVFIEDHVWVDGQINTAQITVVAGAFPDTPGKRKSITVNDNLLYTNYDGQDRIGLIAQEDINAGMHSANILRIDAALIAQHGRIGRYYYRPASGHQDLCSPYDVRDTITLYGMLATNERYGFAYNDGNGYQYRNLLYDPHLLYSPPPSWPLSSEFYEVLSWEEVE